MGCSLRLVEIDVFFVSNIALQIDGFEGHNLEVFHGSMKGILHYLYTPSSQGNIVGECEV